MTDPTEVTLPVTIDLTRFTAALERAAETARAVFDRLAAYFRDVVGPALARIHDRMTGFANDPVRVAGVEAKFYVRAGLDGAYAHPERRDALIRDLLHGEVEDEPFLFLMTPENRRLVALSAIRGWVSTYGAPAPGEHPYVAHRLWGTDRGEVRCG